MKKVIVFIPILFFLTLFVFNAEVVFASSCTQIGNTTYCDDGTSYNQIGNTIYGSDGSSYNQIGNTTYGNDGSSCNQIGNTTYCSDGTSYNQIGNTIYGSDGSSYNQIGNTTYGSGNTYSTCPANSSKDSLTGKCSCDYGYSVNYSKTSCVYTGTTYTAPTTPTCPLNSYANSSGKCTCNYGYVVSASGSSCVYQGSTYSNTPTYSATQNTCPINSHTSATDSTMCQCDAGYQPNATKDGCSLAPIKSNTQVCQGSFGINVDWDGTKAANGDLNCNCKAGYIWNAGRSACILPPAIPTPTPPKISTPTASQTETKPVTPTPPAKKEFLIDDAKIKNYNVELLGETNTSATLRKCPSTSHCDVLRYYVEGVQVKILGDYNNEEWYKIIVIDTKQEGWMHSSIVDKVALQEANPQTDELKESDGKFHEEIPVSEKTQKDAPWYKKVFGFFSNLFK